MMREGKKAAAAPSKRSRRHEATTANTCRLFQLPKDLIFDILSRLSVTDVFHCRCVCIGFLCFISDPEFACLHLSKSPLCILTKTKPHKNASKRFQLAHVEADGASLQVFKLTFTTKSNVPTSNISDMNACNGLLCLVGPQKNDSFYVCNPILGEFITIQPPYKNRNRGGFWGLGYSAVTNQYKLLQSYYVNDRSDKRCIMAEIYTIGTGTWRRIGNAPTDLVSLPFNAFLNGAIHWRNIGCHGEFINCFDFDAEQFGTVPPPDHFRELDKKLAEYTTTGVLGDCLFLIYFETYSRFEIWVMKEYGVKESWAKQFVIEESMYQYLGVKSWDSYQPIVVLNNGEILMLYNDEKIGWYNLKRKHMRGTKFFRFRLEFYATAYTPCFVSLNNVAKGEKISRMQSTRVYDKICAQEFQDCTGG